MTRIEKQMIGATVLFAVGFVAIGNLAVGVGKSAYNEYKNTSDTHKKKCFDQFKFIEYEVINNELYCMTSSGLKKANK